MSQAALLSETNIERAVNSLPLFVTHPALQSEAQLRAERMAATGRQEHGSLEIPGYPSRTVAENISGWPTAKQVVANWMSDYRDGHRQNLLNSIYRTTGCGFAIATNGEVFWCALYGSAKGGEPIPPTLPTIPLPQADWVTRLLLWLRTIRFTR